MSAWVWPSRCRMCASPAGEADGLVRVPHLTWCVRAPRPQQPRPDGVLLKPTPEVEPIAELDDLDSEER